MWTEMQRRNEALVAAMRDMQTLSRQDLPDIPAIARARWRIAEASRKRLEWLIDEVLPYAQQHAGGDAIQRVNALADQTLAYRQRISGFVAVWPTQAIVADWDGYRKAARQLRHVITARLNDEAAVIRCLAPGAHAPQVA